MRVKTRAATMWLGISAGAAGLEHGVFELLQGDTRPEGLMIASMGPPCVPEETWNACEPALTIIPSFYISGIITLALGMLIIVWSVFFIQRKPGGWGLILMSIALLLFGGGIFPPVIGCVAGSAATQINRPLPQKPAGKFLRVIAAIWPWPLWIYLIWVSGQFVVGYFFNEFLMRVMGFAVLLILTTLFLSNYSAYAYDVVKGSATQGGG